MAAAKKGDKIFNMVSRSRRSWFTFCTVGAAITLAYILAIRGLDTKVAQIVAEGLISLATWLGIAYVGASSVDYSIGGGLPKMLGKQQQSKRQYDEDGADDERAAYNPRRGYRSRDTQDDAHDDAFDDGRRFQRHRNDDRPAPGGLTPFEREQLAKGRKEPNLTPPPRDGEEDETPPTRPGKAP